MNLHLIDRRCGPNDSNYAWTPFEPSDQLTSHWWDEPRYLDDDPSFVQVLLDGVEVGRVEMDEDFRGSGHKGAPRLGKATLEIQLIEVSSEHRNRGIGTEVMRRLAAMHSDRRFLAMSEDADAFWASLGWDRYDHPAGSDRHRPLFVQQA
jgi:GNAT superfamily N-acetyltransferase